MEKQSGPEGLKRINAANSVVSLLTGLKSAQREQKMRNNWNLNLNKNLWDIAVSSSP